MDGHSPISVRIAGDSHRISVVAVEGAAFEVSGEARIAHSGRGATVDRVGSRLQVTVPAGACVAVGGSSGRVTVTGPVGDVSVVSSSGRVEVEQASSVDIRTESSQVRVGDVTGTCRIRSESGRVEVASCGAADVASTTGRVALHRIDGVVDAHSVSGRIELTLDHPHDVRAETVSGRIEVSLPPGTVPFRPDGPTDRRLPPPGASCTVSARSETGRVVVSSR